MTYTRTVSHGTGHAYAMRDGTVRISWDCGLEVDVLNSPPLERDDLDRLHERAHLEAGV